jgi:hypothetical protein
MNLKMRACELCVGMYEPMSLKLIAEFYF